MRAHVCMHIKKIMIMTILEIRSVSIRQYLDVTGHGIAYKRRGKYFYFSPYRTESNPSFAVNPDENLWYDYATREGGNIINLHHKIKPNLDNHHVLLELEELIRKHNLQYSEDYESQMNEEQERQNWLHAKQEKEDSETTITGVFELSHPYLRDYILERRVDYDIARRYCKEVHYSIYGKQYYAIGFVNVDGGMEARNKYCKRSIGRKTISAIYQHEQPLKSCCIFEGFFNMLTYATMKRWMDLDLCVKEESDYFVLNSVGNLNLLLPYLANYDKIHCYLDNDDAGIKATKMILTSYPDKAIDESVRYKSYNDINDVINGRIMNQK